MTVKVKHEAAFKLRCVKNIRKLSFGTFYSVIIKGKKILLTLE